MVSLQPAMDEGIPCPVCGLKREISDSHYFLEGRDDKFLLAGPCEYSKGIYSVHQISKTDVPPNPKPEQKIKLKTSVADFPFHSIPADEFVKWIIRAKEKGELPKIEASDPLIEIRNALPKTSSTRTPNAIRFSMYAEIAFGIVSIVSILFIYEAAQFSNILLAAASIGVSATALLSIREVRQLRKKWG